MYWYTLDNQGTPVDMPYLEGFPPKDELPSVTWTSKLAETLVRIILGSIRCYTYFVYSTSWLRISDVNARSRQVMCDG